MSVFFAAHETGVVNRAEHRQCACMYVCMRRPPYFNLPPRPMWHVFRGHLNLLDGVPRSAVVITTDWRERHVRW